jgi:hypothetical protein
MTVAQAVVVLGLETLEAQELGDRVTTVELMGIAPPEKGMAVVAQVQQVLVVTPQLLAG